ncbi:NAD(P)/FAD-dependent oxidoreductase [Amycolatopsis taiwanensis]|uniref:D-amino-acid dehydrogenase n=1 Tax=Amycolatopsis taiwanensis TaxID=342230 RepID=A0A9W6VJW6_9PSEU|nr:FAD-dependent oxidoreductase [Amycolatopsis taiwanensis]GLY69862.1 D-amino-acid dehydrogenase [Amycolatopsis taiwanensis]
MRPRRVVVIGAGMVGLSCAWSLQDYDVEVEVLDRGRAGHGASWGNAGFVAPAFTVPLPEPSILRYGIRAVLDRHSPVRLPVRADQELARFLLRMTRHCTWPQWKRAMAGYRGLNEQIFESFDAQLSAGVPAEIHEADVLAAFGDVAAAAGLHHELAGVAASGQRVEVDLLSGAEAKAAEPLLTDRIGFAMRVRGQRWLDPVAYTAALAEHVRDRGGQVTEQVNVTGVRRHGGGVVVECSDGRREADAVVLANGAWLPALAAEHGVRMPQFGGRGYSFTVPVRQPLAGPLYFPGARSALAPRGDRVRVTGVMEFQRPDAPLDHRAIATIIRALRPLLTGADWDRAEHRWVGARPLSADGIPLVGPSATEGVYVAGGHGMWGVTLGPLTGRMLAEHIATGATPAELAWLDPTR